MLDEAIDKLLRDLRPEAPKPKNAERDMETISDRTDSGDEIIDRIVSDIEHCYWDEAQQDAQDLGLSVTE